MFVKVIDSDGKEIGCIDKSYLVPLGLRHQIARVIVYSRSDNSILLQQRSLSDSSCPGMWDTSASGHVDGHEDPKAAARRELNEELGITVNESQLELVGSFDTSEQLKAGRLERQTFVYCLSLEHKTNNFNIRPVEVEKADWFKLDDVLAKSGIELTTGAAKALQLFDSWQKRP